MPNACRYVPDWVGGADAAALADGSGAQTERPRQLGIPNTRTAYTRSEKRTPSIAIAASDTFDLHDAAERIGCAKITAYGLFRVETRTVAAGAAFRLFCTLNGSTAAPAFVVLHGGALAFSGTMDSLGTDEINGIRLTNLGAAAAEVEVDLRGGD